MAFWRLSVAAWRHGGEFHQLLCPIPLFNSVIVAKPKPGGSEETPGENDDSERKLKASAKSLLYRQPPSSHIVHNKFLIYVDSGGTPQSVLTGSCNWTDTGLCAQTNNSIVIRDGGVAARYMAYWNKLKADEVAHEKGKPFQDAPLRTFNGTGKSLPLDARSSDVSTLTSYFSPNTPKQRSKAKGKTEVCPVDMKELRTRVMAASRIGQMGSPLPPRGPFQGPYVDSRSKKQQYATPTIACSDDRARFRRDLQPAKQLT
jgi:phosphatidylserine/phosphatidylglycerophosphate/cardiolipin synthase-like enzyme